MMNEVLSKVSHLMNADFQVEPILYGSFALEKVLKKSYHAKDIDLLIPHDLLIQKDVLIQSFKDAGFTHQDQEVLSFIKDGILVELADQERWFEQCQMDTDNLYRMRETHGYYRILGAENLRRLYLYLSNDRTRNQVKRQSDLVKFAALDLAIKTKRAIYL